MTNLTIGSPIDIASGCSMRVSFHILGYVALGLLINLIFSIALIPDITGMLKAEVVASGKDVVSGAKDVVSGGKDAIGSAIPRGVTDVVRDPAGWVVAKVIPLVLFTLCAVGFLAAYFLLGKRAGVTSALSYVIDRNKRYLIDRVLGGFASYLSARMSEPRSNPMTYVPQAFEAYRRSLSNQPVVLRWMCWAFVKKFNLDSELRNRSGTSNPKTSLPRTIGEVLQTRSATSWISKCCAERDQDWSWSRYQRTKVAA